MITTVWCAIESGKQYAFVHWKEAREVHAELLAVMHSVLRQVGPRVWGRVEGGRGGWGKLLSDALHQRVSIRFPSMRRSVAECMGHPDKAAALLLCAGPRRLPGASARYRAQLHAGLQQPPGERVGLRPGENRLTQEDQRTDCKYGCSLFRSDHGGKHFILQP